MRKIVFSATLAILLVIGIFGAIQVARGQTETNAGSETIVSHEVQGENVREISAPTGAGAEQPNIGFIDSPTSVCYQPDLAADTCYLNWYYMSVDATPNYMIAMTVTLNSTDTLARVGGFFQTSMYVPYNMFGNGFKVACGALGAGGNPKLGNAYSWTIKARDSANLKSANYGTTYCPAYTP